MAKQNTKEKIFEVSIDLFSQYGYDGVSIRQIAKEVGIKESSIYNHYPSKESILDEILNYYIREMLKEEAPLMQSSQNLDLGFDTFYRIGSERFISKLSEEKMMKITRIFLVESYHNEKINKFLKEAIIGYGVNGWIELFDLMKEKKVIKEDSNSKQLAESFYYYGLFLLYEHFIINYPEDDEKFIEDFVKRTTDHMKTIYNSVKIEEKRITDEEKTEINTIEENKTETNTIEENKTKIINLKENKTEISSLEENKNEIINLEDKTEIIRLEEEKDHEEVENLVRDAFWNIYRPGAYEHYIVHQLREDSSFIEDLAYVIEKDSEIIGHINYSIGKLKISKSQTNSKETDAVVLGPLSIKTEYQSQGYGSKLIEFTLEIAKEKDIPFIFVIGDENYYSRFGFESGSKYNIFLDGTDTSEENPFFMIKLINNSLNEKDYEKGIFLNPKVFNVDDEEVDDFDKNFEYKEKKVLEGQLEID